MEAFREKNLCICARTTSVGVGNFTFAEFIDQGGIMKRAAGLWIDHRKALIVFISDDGEESKEIESDMEKHTRFSGGSRSEQGGGEDQQDRQYIGHLNTYYDEVIALLRDAESILIFGPGEAKGELEKRLANKGFAGRIVGSETVDKMTDRQIAAKVRQHFRK